MLRLFYFNSTVGAILLSTVFSAIPIIAATRRGEIALQSSKPGGSDKKPLDAWEEPLPRFATQRLGTARMRHGRHVSEVAFCSPGEFIATVDGREDVHLWDLKTGKSLPDLKGSNEDGRIRLYDWVSYFPENQTVCAGGFGGELTLWDLKSRKKLTESLAHSDQVTSMAASKDKSIVVTAGYDALSSRKRPTVKVWDGTNLKLIKTLEQTFEDKDESIRIQSLNLSANGAQMLVLADYIKDMRLESCVSCWDMAEGKLNWKSEGRLESFHEWVTLSPDGRIAIGRTIVGTLTFWDAKTGKVLKDMPIFDKVGSVVFAPDGQSFYVGRDDYVIRRFGARDGKEISAIKSDVYLPNVIDASGKTAAGPNRHTVSVLNLETGKLLFPLGNNRDEVEGLVFSSDGTKLAAGFARRSWQLWDLATGKEFMTLQEPKLAKKTKADSSALRLKYLPLAFNTQGDVVALGRSDGIVEIGNAATGNWNKQLKGENGTVTFLALSADGKKLTTANANDVVKVWEMEKGTLIHDYDFRRSPKFHASAFAATPDGNYLAYQKPAKSAKDGQFGYLGVYDLAHDKLLWEVDRHRSILAWHRISLAEDGSSLAAIEHDPKLHVPQGIGLWEVKTGKKLANIGFKERRFHSKVNCVRLCGKANAVAIGLNDGCIELWDVKTGKHITDLAGHRGPIECLALSPDGYTLASGSTDTTIMLWNLRAACAQKENGKGKTLPLSFFP